MPAARPGGAFRAPGTRVVGVGHWLFAGFTWLSIGNGCSLSDLDYLRAERNTPLAGGGAGGSATTGAVGGESTQGSGGTSDRGGAGAGATGGTLQGGAGGTAQGARGGASENGGEPNAGNDGQGGSAGVANTGGSTNTGGTNTGGAGMGAAGDAGAPSGGAPTTDPILVYGIDAQSCKGGLECPGGGSCCRRFEVPAGSFQMGTNTDANAASDEMPAHTTTLGAFELEEFEVTVGRFRRFVELYDGSLPEPGAGAHPGVANSGWRTDFAAQMPATRAALEDQLSCSVGNYQAFTTVAGVRESLPINCVSWYVALAFCIWDGGRLPTEAEWEMASAGGSEKRLYPWGAAAPDFAVHAVANCLGDGVAGCSPADVLPVGSRPAGRGRWGQHDLGGSLWEWVLDYYDATYYQAIGTCSNCTNLSGLTPRVIRGGNFTSLARSLRATGRASKPPNAVDPYAGFRCAHAP